MTAKFCNIINICQRDYEMNAYSIDLRTKVIEFINSGHTRKETVEVFP